MRILFTVSLCLASVGECAGGPCCWSCRVPVVAEMIQAAEGVALAKFVKHVHNEPNDQQWAVLRFAHVHKGHARVGDTFQVPFAAEGKPGELFFALRAEKEQWSEGSIQRISKAGYEYAIRGPKADAPARERIAYSVKHLDSNDETIRGDVRDVLTDLLPDVKRHKELLDRKIIRAEFDRLTTADNKTRLGLMGHLLGECGNRDDAAAMKKLIERQPKEFRLGMEGVMAGYLKLTGTAGLKLLDERKLAKITLFSETYAAMQALIYAYEDGVIPKTRLKQSMRLLLDEPAIADLAIWHLAKWNDWSIHQQLMKDYSTDKYQEPMIRRTIVRYMLRMEQDASSRNADGNSPATQHLAKLRKIDPETVAKVERFSSLFN